MDREVVEQDVAAVSLDGVSVAHAAVAEVEKSSHRDGSAERKARDAVFRRSLFIADAIAILGAFVLAVALSSR